MQDATLNVTGETMSSLQNVVIDFKKTQKQLIEDSASISENNTKLVASINETQLKNEKLLQDTLEEVKQLLQTQQAGNKDLFQGIVEKQNEDAAANINTIIRELNNKQSYDSKIVSLLNLLLIFQQSIISISVSSLAVRLLIYFFVSATITFDRSNTATRFGSAISAFRISATVQTRFNEITGAITATAM